LNGLEFFLNFAFENTVQGDEILCLCKECSNRYWGNRKKVHEHLLCVGFDKNYTRWVFHGECGSSKKICDDEREKFCMHNDLDNLLEETFMMPTNLGENEDNEEFDTETTRFTKLIRDAHQEVYPGCKKFSKLSIIVRLLHIKNLYGWSNVSFDMLLKFVEELLPENSCLPSSYQDSSLSLRAWVSVMKRLMLVLMIVFYFERSMRKKLGVLNVVLLDIK